MRVLAIVALACVAGCTAEGKEESVFPEPAGSEVKSAPVEAPAEVAASGETALPGHTWFEVRIPSIADGVIELNVAENEKRKLSDLTMMLLDGARKPIVANTKGWLTTRVTRGKTYWVDVYDPSGSEARLVSSFKPVVDDFEPNDDAASAHELEGGKANPVRLFAGLDKNAGIDADFFRVKTKGKDRISLRLVNGSSGGTFCVDVMTNDGNSVGATCSAGDIDASFQLASPSPTVIVKLTGTNGPDASTLTITPE